MLFIVMTPSAALYFCYISSVDLLPLSLEEEKNEEPENNMQITLKPLSDSKIQSPEELLHHPTRVFLEDIALGSYMLNFVNLRETVFICF